MIDICTVVSGTELSALRLQAQSVGLWCQGLGVRNIYVILNDAETVISEIDVTWWGAMAPHVLVVPRSAFSAGWLEDSEVSSQLWRMLAASMSYNVYSMMLDVNTVIAGPLTLAALFDTNGRIGAGRIVIDGEPLTMLEQLYGVTVPDLLVTNDAVFFAHNDTVRFMISDTTVRVRKSFPVWFQQQALTDWRLLYCAYMTFKYGNYDAFYQDNNQPHCVYIGADHAGLAEQCLDRMQQARFVGIEPTAWSQLSTDQQQRYRMTLIDLGIHRAWDYQPS